MGQAISKLTIKGYKSIKNLENFELRNINILIGPNGSGKSNFLSFFELFRTAGTALWTDYVKKIGKVDRLFYFGIKTTTQISANLTWKDKNFLNFSIKPTEDNFLYIKSEGSEGPLDELYDKSSLHWYLEKIDPCIEKNFLVYHLNDTSNFASFKRLQTKRDYEYLRPDGSNLAAFLLFLKKKHKKEYQNIREVIQLAAPFFDDFLLRDSLDNPDETLLEWRQKGSDYPFHPSQISDGTLRFICLATALLQPNPPSTILLDEPELGLHPYALVLLAGLIQKASKQTQVIVSTQSASLVDQFQPEDIVIVERKNGESIFKRLNKDDLKVWLDDYSLGELWEMNIFGGRPSHE
ncbi:MAG: AAA family ATPase [Sedimentisphaerales bacterium]|nr:AAA family ATPase [Sedimentisphaerales bacterium]